MIKIVKDSDERYVTKGMFYELYEDMGYEIVEEKKKPQQNSFAPKQENKQQDKEDKLEPKDSKESKDSKEPDGSNESNDKDNNDLRNK